MRPIMAYIGRPMAKRYAFILFAIFGVQALAAQVPTNRPLRVIAFGAHPDDAELKFAGTAALFAAQGAKVKLVAMTNGDVGHFAQAGGPLAQRRKAEVETCQEARGRHDASTSTTAKSCPTSRRGRRYNLIAVATDIAPHRPWTILDHRNIGKLAKTARAPSQLPFRPHPPDEEGAHFLYYSTVPEAYPFDQIIAIGFDSVAQKSGTASATFRRSC